MAASSTTKVLEPARNAVWTALRNWPNWTAKIQTICDTDARVREFIRQEASVARCPMLSVLWRQTNPEWWVHSQQNWKVPLELSIWVTDDQQSLSENLLEDAIDAVFRHETNASVAQGREFTVKKEVGVHPVILAMEIGVPIQAGVEGKHRLLQSLAVFQLEVKKNPIMAANQ